MLWSVLAVLGAVALAPLASAQAVGQGNGYVATYQDWEVRRLAAEAGGAPLCAARALHPAVLEGEIFWVFNPDRADSLPHGYFTVDWRLFFRAEGGRIAIADGPDFALRQGRDRVGYNHPEEAGALLAALRAGLDMVVTIDGPDVVQRDLPVSLRGFTRATDAARRACEMA